MESRLQCNGSGWRDLPTRWQTKSWTHQFNACNFMKSLCNGGQSFVQTSDGGTNTARSDHGRWVQHELAVCKTHSTEQCIVLMETVSSDHRRWVQQCNLQDTQHTELKSMIQCIVLMETVSSDHRRWVQHCNLQDTQHKELRVYDMHCFVCLLLWCCWIYYFL